MLTPRGDVHRGCESGKWFILSERKECGCLERSPELQISSRASFFYGMRQHKERPFSLDRMQVIIRP